MIFRITAAVNGVQQLTYIISEACTTYHLFENEERIQKVKNIVMKLDCFLSIWRVIA